MSISILSQTHQSFVEAVDNALGKGRQHALHVYQEWFREGKITGKHPSFSNAALLLKSIIEKIECAMPTIVSERTDGITGKMILRAHDGLEIESVLIPMQSGGTLCISSQVGCRMGCAFCETGRMGLLRNLTVEEIVSQVFLARHQMHFQFRNVVFMGMGEPFDNIDAVMQAVKVLTDAYGFGFGKRQITISTSGRGDGIEYMTSLGKEGPNLAVSINAPIDTVRNRLMPINRQYDLKALHEVMDRYCQQTGNEILIAYVLMKGQNDALDHAEALCNYLKGLRVKINLIPYNPQSRDRFQPPDSDVIQTFTQLLRNRGFYTLLRVTKGRSIMAACGQLGNLELRKNILMSGSDPDIRD